jgi:hypothetical protein
VLGLPTWFGQRVARLTAAECALLTQRCREILTELASNEPLERPGEP